MKPYLLALLPLLILLFSACDDDNDINDGRCNGPDPAITAIGVDDVTPPVTYTITIENQGRADFISGIQQQAVYIYIDGNFFGEWPFPASSTSADEAFLGVDESFTVSFVDSTILSPGDSIRYRFLLAYDPDIFIDGNPDNDDCDLDNNEMVVTYVEN
jgi:hypothetical protein